MDQKLFEHLSNLDEAVDKQGRKFRIIRPPRKRKCHSCSRQIEAGELIAIGDVGSQSSFNVCGECLESAYSTYKEGGESFKFDVGDKVVIQDPIERKWGYVPGGMIGTVTKQMSGDKYKVEIPFYYGAQRSNASSQGSRASLAFGSKYVKVDSSQTLKLSGAKLRHASRDELNRVPRKELSVNSFAGTTMRDSMWLNKHEAMSQQGKYAAWSYETKDNKTGEYVKFVVVDPDEMMSEAQREDIIDDLGSMGVEVDSRFGEVQFPYSQLTQKVRKMLEKNHGVIYEED